MSHLQVLAPRCDSYLKWSVWIVIVCVHRLSEDGTVVRETCKVDTCHELCFMICNLFYFIMCICWSIYWIDFTYSCHWHTTGMSHVVKREAYGCKSLSSLTLWRRRKLCNLLPPLLDSRPLKMGSIGCPETSVIKYHYPLRNNSEERSSHLSFNDI